MSEKTEEPTPRRLAKARKKGDVAVSAVLSQAVGFLVALAVVPSAIAATAARATQLFRAALETEEPVMLAKSVAFDVALASAPLLFAVAAASAAATIVQTGALFAPARVLPSLTKLDMIAGLGSLVSGARIWSLTRALLAALAVAYLGWGALGRHVRDLSQAVGNTEGAVAIAAVAGKSLARDAALVGLALSVIDIVVVRRAFRSKLKMSKSEVKREQRESEGDPQWKGARQRAHQEMLAAATVNAVRDATVVIVNPEHLATALRYVEGEDDAPKVVAAGDGDLARRIQEAARAYGIPVIRDVPVARALQELQVGDTIPQALYEAVAEILSEIWKAEEADPSARG